MDYLKFSALLLVASLIAADYHRASEPCYKPEFDRNVNEIM